MWTCIHLLKKRRKLELELSENDNLFLGLIPVEILMMPFLGGRWGSPLTSTACGNKSKQGIFDQ